MHRCYRDLDTDIPVGMYYDCQNDVFRPIQTQENEYFMIYMLVIMICIYLFILKI